MIEWRRVERVIRKEKERTIRERMQLTGEKKIYSLDDDDDTHCIGNKSLVGVSPFLSSAAYRPSQPV